MLLVTYYFPPSGGSGVQRPLKFAKYLPECGWQPIVLTVRPDRAVYPAYDAALGQEIPPGLHVERTGAWDPYALYARLMGKKKEEVVSVGFAGEGEPTWKQWVGRWVRANIFLPDARVGWVPFAIHRARQLLAEERIDAILTTGPPHSTHLIGRMLAGETGLPWIADFRDPWTEIDYADALPTTRCARYVDEALERSVVENASLVTVVTPRWQRDLERRIEGRYSVLRNGFDPADFLDDVGMDDQFVITHAGSLNAARNPGALWRALSEMNAVEHMPALRVRLVGKVDPVVMEDVRACGLEKIVEVVDYVPHDDAIRLMQESALLLLAINRADNRMGIIPGKVYEYLAAGRPVLGLGPSSGDAAAVLRDTDGGTMCGFEDTDAVEAFIRRHYEAWEEGRPIEGASPEAVAPYSRRAQTRELAEALDALVHTQHTREAHR